MTNILLLISTFIFLIAGLDILLNEAQKNTLSNKLVLLWNRLDELKKLSFLNPLRKLSVQIIIGLLSAIIIGAAIYPFGLYLVILLTIPAIICICPLLLSFILRDNNIYKVCLKSIGVIVAYVCLLLLTEKLSDPPGWMGPSIGFLVTFIWLTLLLLVIIIPLFLILLASTLLYIFEYVIRRISEYPKGPILALSGLLSAILAFVKAF